MRKAKYITECCDVCGEYVLGYEQELITLVGETGVVTEAFYVHGGNSVCAKTTEKFLTAIAAKWNCGLEVERVGFIESATPKLDLARLLRRLLTHGMISEEKLRQRVRKRLGDLQIILSPAPGVPVREDHYKQLQLDDVCNLKMLQKILSLTSNQKVTDWGDQLVVENSDRLRNGLATVISAQLANLVNSWGMEVVDAMIAIQETGVEAYTAITKLEHLVEELGVPVSEAPEVLRNSMAVKTRTRM